MSFPTDYCYTISANRELLDCAEIDREFAELLVSDPYIYRNPGFIGESSITDEDHERFIKLLFLANLKSEYTHHFFGGQAPMSVEFFDQWWTLTRSYVPRNVATVVRELADADFESLMASLSGCMIERVKRFRRGE